MQTIKEKLQEYAELVHNLALGDYDNTIYCIEIGDAEKVCKEYASLRTSKLEELVLRYKELTLCLENSTIETEMKAELRKHISELRKELNLK